jgi:hypothetical protein
VSAATVLIALSVPAALAQAALAQWMRRFLPVVGRLGGLALTVSGCISLPTRCPELVTLLCGLLGGWGHLDITATTQAGAVSPVTTSS